MAEAEAEMWADDPRKEGCPAPHVGTQGTLGGEEAF